MTVPLFAAVCTHDTVAPSRTSLRYLRRAPRAEVKEYDHGHFEIYLGDAFEEVVADELDFLGRHVPAV